MTGPVVDSAGVLSADAKNNLTRKIREVYDQGSGPQITILTLKSLQEYSIEEVAIATFTQWKLGEAKRDDGVLFIIVPSEKKMRIEVGQGLEGTLTDAESKRILVSLRNDFKQKNFAAGISSGLDQIITFVTKEGAVQGVPEKKMLVAEPPKPRGEEISSEFILAFIALIGAIVFTFFLCKKMALTIEKYNTNKKNNKELTSEVRKMEKRPDISKVLEKLEEKNASLKKEASMISDQFEDAQITKNKSPRGQLEQLRLRRRSEEITLKSIKDNTAAYNDVTGGGK